jgi:hypothetical protein
MRRALPVLIAVLVLAAAPAAGADSGSATDPSGDLFGGQPTGNSSGSLDIVRVTWGHSRGRLVHTVTTAGNVGDPASSTNFPVMFFEFEHSYVTNGTSECAFFAGRHNGRLGIFRCGYGSFVASARITRTSARTVRYEFSPRALRNPPSYQWSFLTRSDTQYATAAGTDRFPNGEREFRTHVLRR